MTREVGNEAIDDETALYITDDDEIWDSLPPLQKAISGLLGASETIEDLARTHNASATELQGVVEQFDLVQCEICQSWGSKEELTTYEDTVMHDGRYICENCRIEEAMAEAITTPVEFEKKIREIIKDNLWEGHGLCYEPLEEDMSGNDFGDCFESNHPYLEVQLEIEFTSDLYEGHRGAKMVYGGIDMSYNVPGQRLSDQQEETAEERISEVVKWIKSAKVPGCTVKNCIFVQNTFMLKGARYAVTIPVEFMCKK